MGGAGRDFGENLKRTPEVGTSTLRLLFMMRFFSIHPGKLTAGTQKNGGLVRMMFLFKSGWLLGVYHSEEVWYGKVCWRWEGLRGRSLGDIHDLWAPQKVAKRKGNPLNSKISRSVKYYNLAPMDVDSQKDHVYIRHYTDQWRYLYKIYKCLKRRFLLGEFPTLTYDFIFYYFFLT